jgi:hypothetical protein
MYFPHLQLLAQWPSDLHQSALWDETVREDVRDRQCPVAVSNMLPLLLEVMVVVMVIFLWCCCSLFIAVLIIAIGLVDLITAAGFVNNSSY